MQSPSKHHLNRPICVVIDTSFVCRLEGTNQPSDEELIRQAKAKGGDDYNRIDFELVFPGPPSKGKESTATKK